MTMRFKVPGGTFTVRPGPTLITLIMLGGLLSLGFWQVERLAWKENLLATIHARMEMPAIYAAGVDPAESDYRPAYANGVFDYGHEIYIHAISLAGEGGWHVLTPLKLDDGWYLFVDRGFVNYGAAAIYRPEGNVSVKGVLRMPSHHWPQPNNNPAKNDWYWPDLAAAAKMMGVQEFLPFYLEADATPSPNGWPVGGQTRLDIPNNHFIYALIWFGLALALIVIYGVSSYRKVS